MAQTIDEFYINVDRYKWDNELGAEGFAQWDTREDASYYGSWINAETLEFASYAEGDYSRTKYSTRVEFVQAMNEWAERLGSDFKGIDPGWKLEDGKPFIQVGLEHLLYESYRTQPVNNTRKKE